MVWVELSCRDRLTLAQLKKWIYEVRGPVYLFVCLRSNYPKDQDSQFEWSVYYFCEGRPVYEANLVLVSMASNQNRDAFPVSWTVFRWALQLIWRFAVLVFICCIEQVTTIWQLKPTHLLSYSS